MPRYAIERQYLLPVYAHDIVAAPDFETACRRLIESDNWSDAKRDFDNARATTIEAAVELPKRFRADATTALYSADLPQLEIPAEFREQPRDRHVTEALWLLVKRAEAMLDAYGGDIPDWLASEADDLDRTLVNARAALNATDKPPPRADIRSFLTVAAHHLPVAFAEDLRMRDPVSWPLSGMQGDSGLFLYAHEEIDDDRVPAEVMAIFAHARALGCSYVLFDQDAEDLPGFPVFEPEV